jgi:hypothetical protein
VAGVIRFLAIGTSAVVVLGFFLFAIDEAGKSSDVQITKIDEAIAEPTPSPAEEVLRERAHSQGRELIDDANDALLSPFTGWVESGDIWVQRLVPAVLALLAYLLGGLFLANYLPQPKRRTEDWREAT